MKAVDDDVRRVVADMTDSMYAQNGAGLAAIQIGDPLRIFIVDGASGRRQPSKTRPRSSSTRRSSRSPSESQTGDEGCLSFPNIFVPVKRGMRARVRAMDLEGNIFEAEGEELYARAMQHETDHLNGRLLIDQVGPVKRELIKRKLRRDAEAERAEAEEADAEDG